MKGIRGAKLVVPGKILEGYSIVFDEKIQKILPENEIQGDVEWIDFDGYVTPGFIDIHIHGAGGSDAMDAQEDTMDTIAKTVVKGGTTSFLATTMTMDKESIVNALDAIKEHMEQQKPGDGAQVLGVHLEGPFINVEFKGAQNPKYIQKPTEEWLKPYYPIVKVITMAPECDENMKHVKLWSEKGIVVSLGHSAATYDQVKAAYEAGAKNITHCFNGMSPFHHRDPGMVGGALVLPFNVEIITDTIHFHKDLYKLVVEAKGVDKVILITDAIRAGFSAQGESELGGQKVYIKDGACRLENGSLAGSIHQMDKAVQNMTKYTTCTLEEVVQMASYNPAKLLGINHRKGSLAEGLDADLLLLDHDLTLCQTYVNGIRQEIG